MTGRNTSPQKPLKAPLLKHTKAPANSKQSETIEVEERETFAAAFCCESQTPLFCWSNLGDGVPSRRRQGFEMNSISKQVILEFMILDPALRTCSRSEALDLRIFITKITNRQQIPKSLSSSFELSIYRVHKSRRHGFEINSRISKQVVLEL
ncbi:hypothetical protein CDAR_472571 [Caerostris darwini]|uniref:Uncharacterized protein n=1 Tax=Caerostris darwini TaxID=1538125 RepID=A0AAV4RXS0_9ARAC|nr:hypothetical protein CDAR_472571 [Caerostris darwini]